LLELDAGGPDGCEGARVLAERRIEDLTARIRDLQRMRSSLTDLIATDPATGNLAGEDFQAQTRQALAN
jgi:hypothetical protein